MEEYRAMKAAQDIIHALIGPNRASPVHIKNKTLIIKCDNSTTAHFLNINKEQIREAAGTKKVRFIS